jgi:hypothetical protein
MTDTNKYKSNYRKNRNTHQAKEVSGKDRKISGIVSSLVDKEFEKRKAV